MALILIGVLLIIAGVVLATLKTLKRGRLSQSREPGSGEQRDTLEPTGKGDRLALQADLPGIGLCILGAILILAGSIF
jgi:drug/metabolite transporter (DMT)-like permease